MLLLVKGLCYELGCSRLPIISRRLVFIREVEPAVAVVRHESWPVLNVKVGLSEVPVVVFGGLRVQLVLLLVTECRRLHVSSAEVYHFSDLTEEARVLTEIDYKN